MENYTIFFLLNTFIIDLFLLLIMRRWYKLKFGLIYALFLQVINLSVAFIKVYLDFNLPLFLILKILANIIICLLTTNSYKISYLNHFISAYNIFYFSIYGFIKFFIELINYLLVDYNIKLSSTIIIICLILYLFILQKFTDKIAKNKYEKNFLAQVSFFLLHQHIELKGLIDSGNSLYDNDETPVIIVSQRILLKYIDKSILKEMLENSKTIKCSIVGENSISLTLLKIDNVTIKKNDIKMKCNCILGVSINDFYDGSDFECLLHKDFI